MPTFSRLRELLVFIRPCEAFQAFAPSPLGFSQQPSPDRKSFDYFRYESWPRLRDAGPPSLLMTRISARAGCFFFVDTCCGGRWTPPCSSSQIDLPSIFISTPSALIQTRVLEYIFFVFNTLILSPPDWLFPCEDFTL